MTRRDILALIEADAWMMSALRAARALNLPDWMIGAGFVRGKVWDHLHGYKERTPLNDLDLIYFDPANLDESQEKEYDRALEAMFEAPWSAKNQARMHLSNKEPPYRSSEDALAHWVEVPTCIAVALSDDGLRLIAPHGIEDLVGLRVRPTPFERARRAYPLRIAEKDWKRLWPQLEILDA